MGELEKALTLEGAGGGQWLGRADPTYEANNGMFGGLSAALLLKSVMSEAEAQGSPSALTVNFVRAITPGSDIAIRTRLLGASRSIQHWTAELAIAGSNDVCAHASVVTTTRRDTDGFVEPEMPAVPPPEADLEITYPPNAFGRQSPVRRALGTMTEGSHLGKSHSALWTREVSGRAIDAIQIAYLCDNYPPRAFFAGGVIRPSATLTYSVYFVSTAEELAAIGDDYTLIDTIGTRAAHGTVGSRVNLWSRAGRLLATSEQLCWYR